ncbi:MAG: translation initiation factor IF-2 N-terminal domain-containing protein, partial [Cyanobacteria bacterium P01_H01_bin.58]
MNNSKVRIYELSKELNLENKDILTICERLGIAAKSHSSTITDEDALRIRSEVKQN